jgi:hypothetical protein
LKRWRNEWWSCEESDKMTVWRNDNPFGSNLKITASISLFTFINPTREPLLESLGPMSNWRLFEQWTKRRANYLFRFTAKNMDLSPFYESMLNEMSIWRSFLRTSPKTSEWGSVWNYITTWCNSSRYQRIFHKSTWIGSIDWSTVHKAWKDT